MTQPNAHPPGSVSPRNRDVTVLAVDDGASCRAALRELIASARGFALVGEACSGEEATRAVKLLLPQLVLMDVRMPGMGGIAAAGQILDRHPSVTVILMSVEDPSLHAGARSLGSTVLCTRKQELRAGRLRELWQMRPN